MKMAFRDVRGGAPLAGLFCGHYCGYRRGKLWASKNSHGFGGSGMALTIKEVDNAKSNGKPYRLADGGGLCPFVAPIVAAMIIICKDPADLCADGIISLKVGEPDRLLSTCFLLLLDARSLGGLGR